MPLVTEGTAPKIRGTEILSTWKIFALDSINVFLLKVEPKLLIAKTILEEIVIVNIIFIY